MKYSIVLFFLFFFFTNSAQDNLISKSDLIGCWTHSREEDRANSDIMVYRKCDSKEFPVSRYRHQFELKEKGKCLWLSLSSNDSHSMTKGRWTYEKENQILKILDSRGKTINKYIIVAFEDKRMELKNYK